MESYVTQNESNEGTVLECLPTYLSTLAFYNPKVLGKQQQTGQE